MLGKLQFSCNQFKWWIELKRIFGCFQRWLIMFIRDLIYIIRATYWSQSSEFGLIHIFFKLQLVSEWKMLRKHWSGSLYFCSKCVDLVLNFLHFDFFFKVDYTGPDAILEEKKWRIFSFCFATLRRSRFLKHEPCSNV